MQVLKINAETLKLMTKFGGGMLAILLIVFLVAVVTPFIAHRIDKTKNNPARVKNDPYKFEKDDVKSVYEVNINDDKEDENDG